MSRTKRNYPSSHVSENWATKYGRDGGFSSGICWSFKAGILYQRCGCGCEQGGSVNKRYATKVRRAFEKRDTRARLYTVLAPTSQTVLLSVV